MTAIDNISQGKGLSFDLLPDDAFSREEIKALALKDFGILFNAPPIGTLRTAKAMLLSKTGSKIVSPENTRMIVINTLARKIVDRTIYELTHQ